MYKLSIVEKAIRYDEAIKKLRSLHDNYDTVSTLIDVKEELENIFPELAESEDERVKKAIFGMVYDSDNELWSSYDVSKSDVLAWLEKHSQVKEFPISQYENKTCKENDDSLTSEDERIGKAITEFFKNYSKNGIWKAIPNVTKWIAWLEEKCEQKEDNPPFNDPKYLAGFDTGREVQKIFDEQKPTEVELKFHEGDMIIHKELGGDYIHNPHKIIQVDILDKKYRLEGGLVAHFSEQDDYELVEKKPWNEEDEEMYKKVETAIDSYYAPFSRDSEEMSNWLKKLKDRVLPQPKQEWSEEDKKLIDDTCNLINTLASGYGTTNVTEPITFTGSQMIANIKSRLRALVDCRPQSLWKPSEEQMENLSRACNGGTYRTSLLMDLYQDLEKLMEE